MSELSSQPLASNASSIDWKQLPLADLLDALNVPPKNSQSDINWATRALGYALFLRGWEGSVETRYRGSMVSLGGGVEEACLVWQGEKLNAHGNAFSPKLTQPGYGSVSVRTYEGGNCFPPLMVDKKPGLLEEMKARVEAFILSCSSEMNTSITPGNRPRF